MGAARAPSTDAVTSLGAWLDTLPAPKPSSTASPAQLARGRAAFEKASCDGCHSGPQLSNHLPVSVGTAGGEFKTPPLVGLAARGPWMHDGCAKTLRQRFTDTACVGTLHGNPEVLSPWELTDLLAYLESL
jgi:cytochrome c peroxidase